MDQARIHLLSDELPAQRGRWVLYWMQAAQRERFNPALEYAVRRANANGVPVLVAVGVDAGYPEANARHFAFMLEGLAEVEQALKARGIGFTVRLGTPDEVALGLAEDALEVVCDRGYLRHQRRWRDRVAEAAGRRVTAIEGEVVVPVETASDKREFAARTLRPKVNALRDRFLGGLARTRPLRRMSPQAIPASDLVPARVDQALDLLGADKRVAPVRRFRGGTRIASKQLTRFLRGALDGYAGDRNDPAMPRVSLLGPYLHFGQISPVEIAHRVARARGCSAADREAFLEELVVRRELAVNYVWFEPDYDRYEALPDWARKTLAEHASDGRPARYSRDELEGADTADRYWNAAMREMAVTGYMHNHLRMYWGKKILEWSATPSEAFATALELNNRYFLDGRDANSYANVAWLFGLHDRPWQERPVFGKVRSMTAAGLERKFDMDGYLSRVAALVDDESDA